MDITECAKNNDLDNVKQCIELFSQDVNKRELNEFGYTPLMWATQNGNLEMVEYLCIEANANVNIRDNNGCSCLYRAAQLNRMEIANFLLKQKDVEIDASDKDGRSPLFLASSLGFLEIAQYLILSGASIAGVANFTIHAILAPTPADSGCRPSA